MRCPNCNAEVREGAAFCGSCGAAIAAAPGAPVPPPVVPPASVPPAPPAPTPAAAPSAPQAAPGADEQAEYERQLAEYQRQRAEYDRQQAAYAPQGAALPPAAKKNRTGLVIAIIALALLLLCGCVVGGVLLLRAAGEDAVEIEGLLPADDPETPAAGFATPDDAVKAYLEESGTADWTYMLYDESDGSATYWAGPPASEYVEEIVVERAADGTWSVGSTGDLQFGGDVPEGEASVADQAAQVVYDHLLATQEDRSGDAQALTIDPFSSDPASAQYSGGQFTYFEITGVTEQSDGSAWVATSQVWYGTTESYEYLVVPTEAGYRIADLRIP